MTVRVLLEATIVLLTGRHVGEHELSHATLLEDLVALQVRKHRLLEGPG